MYVFSFIFIYGTANIVIIAKSDPYCVLSVVKKHDFSLFGSTQKTSVINNNQNPVWNQSFSLNVSNPEAEILKIKVYDNDPLSFDDEIGTSIAVFSYYLG